MLAHVERNGYFFLNVIPNSSQRTLGHIQSCFERVANCISNRDVSHWTILVDRIPIGDFGLMGS